MKCWDTEGWLWSVWQLGRAWQHVWVCECVSSEHTVAFLALRRLQGRTAPLYFTIVPSLLLRATSLCRRATASFSLNKKREMRGKIRMSQVVIIIHWVTNIFSCTFFFKKPNQQVTSVFLKTLILFMKKKVLNWLLNRSSTNQSSDLF